MWQTKLFKVVCNFLLAIMLSLSIVAIPATKPVKAVSFVVNSLSDSHDWNPADGVCETALGSGICTLRAAIETAITSGDTITFNPILDGYTITLSERLVMSTSGVILTGAGRNITISGSGISHAPGVPGECLLIGGSSIWVEFLTIRDCPTWGVKIGEYENNNQGNYNTLNSMVIVGNSSGGVGMEDTDGDWYGGNNNTIDYSYIGSISANPSSCIVSDSNGYGIGLFNGAYNNTIIGNQIVCNNLDGINSYNTDSNTIRGNTISANLGTGINLSDSWDFTIDQNYIGNYEGLGAAGNQDGILIQNSCHHITIGGATTTAANVISGNTYTGIFLTGNSTTVTINNNAIGTNAYLNAALPNGTAGIAIVSNTIPSDAGSSIVIGDDNYTTSHQYISGNTREGIYIESSNNIKIKDSNLIGRGNFSSSTEVKVGNGLEGIKIVDSPLITVGGYAIAYNSAAGIRVEGDPSQGDWLHALRIYSNGGLPIDLVPVVGHNPNDLNDSDAGPNTLLNYPVVTGISGGYLYGESCANCRVYFFLAKGDPSKPGGGYVDGSLGYVTASDLGAYGLWSVPYPINGTAYIQNITMLSLHVGSGNTSELSPRPTNYLPFIRK